MAKDFKILPKWRNFAKSGHTVGFPPYEEYHQVDKVWLLSPNFSAPLFFELYFKEGHPVVLGPLKTLNSFKIRRFVLSCMKWLNHPMFLIR